MTQEDKLLLLKDLSMRLPYKCKYKASKGITHWHKLTLSTRTIDKIIDDYYDDIKPYLRPMSSMTKEEKSYYEDRWFEGYHCLHGDDMVSEPEIPSYIDWLLSNHFDFRGLISKGLAIEVKEGIYEY